MAIIRNLKKDFDEGRMDGLRSISFNDTGTEAPYITKSAGSSSNEITRRIDDTARMVKMLTDKPGITHLAKEAVLKQSEISRKLETNLKYQNGSAAGNFLRRVGSTVAHVAKVAASTVAQVPVNGTGTHFVRGFFKQTYLQENGIFNSGVYGSTYALNGAPVPTTELSSTSKVSTFNSTPKPEDLGILHIGIEGDVRLNSSHRRFTSNRYSDEKAFITPNTSTSERIQYASKGISIDSSYPGQRNSTAASFTLGSSNSGYIPGDLPLDLTSRYNKYDEYSSFTGTEPSVNFGRVKLQMPIPTGQSLGFKNTTAPPGALGRSSSFSPDEKDVIETENDISAYNSALPYIGTSTKDNVVNVKSAAPVATTFKRNSTATKKDLGISNKEVEGDEFEQINTSTYTSGSTYTTFSTLENRLNSSVGKPVNGATGSRQTTAELGSFGVTNINPTGEFIQGLTGKEVNVFSIGRTQTTQSTANNILSVQPDNTPYTSKRRIPLKGESLLTSYTVPLFEITTQDTQVYNSEGITGEGIDYYFNGFEYTGKNTEDLRNLIKNKPRVVSEQPLGLVPENTNKGNIIDLSGIQTAIKFANNALPKYQGKNSSIEYGAFDVAGAEGEGKIKHFIQDFRVTGSKNPYRVGDDLRESKTYDFDYSSKTIDKDKRVNMGNPGLSSRNRTDYSKDSEFTYDKLNALDVSDTKLDGDGDSRDLIQLEFGIITPENKNYYLGFRAFLDTFDDSFTGTWNSSKYLGRADSFFSYNGFDRTINIGFKIAAQSRQEMKNLYRKVATLASVTAPTYGNGQFMRGSLAKVTVGDYIYQQPGIIESVTYTWQKDYPWEISFQNPENEGASDQILPHVLDVAVTFKVIHDFLPTTGKVPFITNQSAAAAGGKKVPYF